MYPVALGTALQLTVTVVPVAKPEASLWASDYVAAVGTQGWELVSVTFGGEGQERSFWFKRPSR